MSFIASRIVEAVDTHIDPCTDFFEFACGTWNRRHVIPDDKPNYSTFSKLRDDLEVAMKGQRSLIGYGNDLGSFLFLRWNAQV